MSRTLLILWVIALTLIGAPALRAWTAGPLRYSTVTSDDRQTMYVVWRDDPKPHIADPLRVLALDLTTGKPRWQLRRSDLPPDWREVSGLFIEGEHLIVSGSPKEKTFEPALLAAIDLNTGAIAWSRADAGWAADADTVILTSKGDALDPATGEPRWRFDWLPIRPYTGFVDAGSAMHRVVIAQQSDVARSVLIDVLDQRTGERLIRHRISLADDPRAGLHRIRAMNNFTVAEVYDGQRITLHIFDRMGEERTITSLETHLIQRSLDKTPIYWDFRDGGKYTGWVDVRAGQRKVTADFENVIAWPGEERVYLVEQLVKSEPTWRREWYRYDLASGELTPILPEGLRIDASSAGRIRGDAAFHRLLITEAKELICIDPATRQEWWRRPSLRDGFTTQWLNRDTAGAVWEDGYVFVYNPHTGRPIRSYSLEQPFDLSARP